MQGLTILNAMKKVLTRGEVPQPVTVILNWRTLLAREDQ